MNSSHAPFHIMVKPRGPICNLDCTYCYYLEKERLYPEDTDFRMSSEVLEAFIRQYLDSQPGPAVTFGWQGGEPTLLGLDFFREVVALQHTHGQGRKVANTFQTNGTLLDDEWCQFLASEGFLVGISVDGPEELHDAYRVDKGGKPSFQKVMAGLDLLKKHGVEFNTLTVVSEMNARHPLRVYEFLKEIGSSYHQYIPLVERSPGPEARVRGLALAGPPGLPGLFEEPGLSVVIGPPGESTVLEPECEPGYEAGSASGLPTQITPWSVDAAQWGEFLVRIFEEWVRKDVGRIFVQTFDAALARWVGMERGLCIFEETCGDALAMEHNGDLYACDHYVYPEFRLGNILETPMVELARSPVQHRFGQAKEDTLPTYCTECEVQFACNGECPKHRFNRTPDGEPGLNYLCVGYRRFFNHIGPHMEVMAQLLAQRRPPAQIMALLSRREMEAAMKAAGRNDPCPCGSGKKLKNCCGRTRPSLSQG